VQDKCPIEEHLNVIGARCEHFPVVLERGRKAPGGCPCVAPLAKRLQMIRPDRDRPVVCGNGVFKSPAPGFDETEEMKSLEAVRLMPQN